MRVSIFNQFGDFGTVIANGEEVPNDPRGRSADINVTTFSLDFGVSRRLSTTFQIPVVAKFQTQSNPAKPENASRNAAGIGDVQLSFAYQVLPESLLQRDFSLAPALGVTFPSGSIDEDGGGDRLPMPFQLGSGQYELRPGLAFYKGFRPQLAFYEGFGQIVWYESFTSRFPLSRNKYDYSFGNEYTIASGLVWTPMIWSSRLSLRAEMVWSFIEKDNLGANAPAPPFPPPGRLREPNGDVANTGGEYLYLGPGVDIRLPGGTSFSLVGLLPLHRGANGDPARGGMPPIGQVAADYVITASFSWQFQTPLGDLMPWSH
jgi:hypothetical protein